MTEPTTQAGKALVERVHREGWQVSALYVMPDMAALVAAIEAEAAAAANSQLAALAEAAQAFQDMDEYQLGDSYQQYEAAKHLLEVLANLPAAAQEWEQRIRAEAYQEGHIKGQGDGYDVAMRDLVEPGRYLDLASPDAERRLAAALMAGGYVRNYASRLGKFNDAYWQQAAASILAALREAASQPWPACTCTPFQMESVGHAGSCPFYKAMQAASQPTEPVE